MRDVWLEKSLLAYNHEFLVDTIGRLYLKTLKQPNKKFTFISDMYIDVSI